MGLDLHAFAWRGTALLAATATGVLAGATTAHAQSRPSNAAASAQEIEELVVTASRREQSVRETPIAVSAYGGQQLEREHVESVGDLVTQSPNIQLGSNGPNTNIAIRGIGTNLQTAGNDPGVAFHVDGVYVPDASLALATLFDVNRVEVLRGPQGTLFGRNATGGAVNIIANTPSEELGFGFDASAGSPAGEHVSAFANGSLTSGGALLARVAVQQTYARGNVDNIAARGPGRLNDQNDYGGRLQLEWRPDEAFSARLLVDYQRSDTNGPPSYIVGTPNSVGLPIQLRNTVIARPGADEVAVTYGARKLLEKGATLLMNWNLGPGSLRGFVSRRHTNIFTNNDGDGTAVDFSQTIFDQERDTTYSEMQYTSNETGRLSYIVGANYFDDAELQLIRVYVPPIFPAPVSISGNVATKSTAVFGHAQYRLTDALKLFGGARYSKDRKRLAETNNFLGARTQTHEWSKPTFEVGAAYDFNDEVTGYAKFATGYKSGGFSAGALAPPFAPETSNLWELGLKGSYFDGRLQANLAVFRTRYRNLQVNQIVGVLAQVTNAAQATIDGAELELVQYVTPDFSIRFESGWLDARFDRFVTQDSAPPALGLLDLKGNRLPQAPKFTIGVGATYSRALANGGKLTLGGRYDWRSRVYFSEFNLPLVSQDSAGRLNAFASYDLPGGKWRLGAYGRNLTDERTFSSMVVGAAVINSITTGTLGPRREYGVEVHYRY